MSDPEFGVWSEIFCFGRVCRVQRGLGLGFRDACRFGVWVLGGISPVHIRGRHVPYDRELSHLSWTKGFTNSWACCVTCTFLRTYRGAGAGADARRAADESRLSSPVGHLACFRPTDSSCRMSDLNAENRRETACWYCQKENMRSVFGQVRLWRYLWVSRNRPNSDGRTTCHEPEARLAEFARFIKIRVWLVLT